MRPASRGLRAERLHQEVNTLELGQPGHGENEIAIFLGAVGPLRRGREQDLGGDAAPALQPLFDFGRDGENLADVSFQEVCIQTSDDRPAGRLLDSSLPGQAGPQVVPEIVVFAQAVVEPADMHRVLDRIAGEAQGDDLVDGPAQAVQADVGESGRRVGPELAAETVLRGQDEVGLMALLAQGPNGLSGDGQMAALDEGDVGGDDQDAFLAQGFSAGCRRLSCCCWS